MRCRILLRFPRLRSGRGGNEDHCPHLRDTREQDQTAAVALILVVATESLD